MSENISSNNGCGTIVLILFALWCCGLIHCNGQKPPPAREEPAATDLDQAPAIAGAEAAGLPDPKLYPPVPLAKVAARDGWVRPRALIVGTVALVKHEDDGDWHFVVTDGGAKVICEIIPELPTAARPKVGDVVQVWGVVRWDGEHKWGELHPVAGWRKKP